MTAVSVSEDNFSRFMADALYGEDGFYTQGGGAGRTRDYMTSPEVGDLFGFIIAAYIDQWFKSTDSDRAIVVEAGCGPGSLAASISRAQMSCADSIEYFLVDISPEHRETCKTKMMRATPAFEWTVTDSFPECELPTLVIANELLDNLIFNIGYVKDVYRNHPEDEELTPLPMAALGRFTGTDALGAASIPSDIGDFRIPLHVGIFDWIQELVAATSNVTDLSLLFFDYVKSVREMEDEMWLRLYADNKRIVGVDEVLRALTSGTRGDITTDVTKEDLHVILDGEGFSKITFTRQNDWLEQNYISEYIGEMSSESNYDQLRKFVSEGPSTTNTSNFAIEADTLQNPDGLGAFTVVTARREI